MNADALKDKVEQRDRPAVPRPSRLATLSIWLPLTGRCLGIPAKMVRSTLSPVVAMIVFQALIMLGVPTIVYMIKGEFPKPAMHDYSNPIVGTGVILALVLGLLCGGEDEENGTADFLQRLPIHPLRMLAEKLAGCAMAFALWLLLNLLMSVLIARVHGSPLYETLAYILERIFYPYHGRDALLSMSLLLFGFGMASAAWIGKLIPAAIVAGVLYMGFILCALYALRGFVSLYQLYDSPWPGWIALMGFAICLAATAARAITREGR